MQQAQENMISKILQLPIFEAAWVLWLLVGLSVFSVAVILERVVFYKRQQGLRKKNLPANIETLLLGQNYASLEKPLSSSEDFSSKVVWAILKDRHLGAQASEEIMQAALKREKLRYDEHLHILATIGSNAPFIGLFGTVLGIVRAFRDLAGNIAEASSTVMAGISEALVATAIGLMVAIPAVVAYNYFKVKAQQAHTHAHVLANMALASIKASSSSHQKG
jgi:biopolymer transport protein ExbB/TolQ